MKKLLVALLVAVLCVPAMAATTVSSAGGAGVMTITVEVDGAVADEEVRGLAVTIQQAEGDLGNMEIATSGDPLAFEVTLTAGSFNTFIDYAFSEGAGYTALGQGHPIAVVDAAGAIDPAVGVQDFAVSAGFLDQAENQAGLGAGTYVITINMAGDADTVFDVALDTLRGGIVGDNLAVTDSLGQVTVTSGECFPACHPDYAEWIAVGEPDSWCFPSQCYGDADGETETIGHGTFTVADNDLAILIASYKQDYLVTPSVLDADFDHAAETIGHGTFRVADNDLSTMLTYYKQGVAADCLVCP